LPRQAPSVKISTKGSSAIILPGICRGGGPAKLVEGFLEP
jgi:hypothetical protein